MPFIILLALFFLIWGFFLSLLHLSLLRLGVTYGTELLQQKNHRRFYYLPLHQKLFPKRSFELLLLTSNLGQHLSRFGYAILGGLSLALIHENAITEWILWLLVWLTVMFLVEDLLVRFLVARSPEKSLRASIFFASFFLYLSLPFTFLFLKFAEGSGKGEGEEVLVDPLEEMKETIVTILREADVKGRLNSSDKKLLESVIHFKDRIVREVMVPRVALFCLPVTTSVREAAKALADEGYSRTPVYRDTIDNMVGVLMFKDVLQLYMDCEKGKKDRALLDQPIDSLVKNVFYTPETKKVSQLLQEFRTKQIHMAIVVDEYGGTEGVVTIEDILEEIVGEIADEYDVDEERLYTSQPSGGWLVDARMSLLDAEEAFGLHFPQEGDYDTIGGYIFHQLGSIPPKGLKIHHEDFDLEILSSTERNIEKVRITPRSRL